jgi:hypothetical protein
MGIIAILINFIAHKKMLKQRSKIILTTQMSKAFCHFEAQSKHILDVTSLQLAPNMTIILSIHTL